jgi:nucleoid DNA-binding protein
MFTKTDLAHFLYDNSNKKIPIKEFDEIITKMFDEIIRQLKKGNEVHIEGFGTIAVTKEMLQPLIQIRKQQVVSNAKQS